MTEDERDILAYQRAKEAYLKDPKTYSIDDGYRFAALGKMILNEKARPEGRAFCFV